jgi:DNA modification methylase
MLINGNCIEEMKKLPDKSVDIMICDLPYGETNCEWDKIIDMEEFWVQFKRIRKSKRTACIHFCSTKFGYSLIKSWEKGFKMDMVWVKRNKTGGLGSKHRPMRNHEMVYFFYEQSPKYNRDKYHKRNNNVKHAQSETTKEKKSDNDENVKVERKQTNFEPVQPASVLEEEEKYTKAHLDNNRGGAGTNTKTDIFSKENIKKFHEENGVGFTPPNPASVLEEEEKPKRKSIKDRKGLPTKSDLYSKENQTTSKFDPPNPASVLEEEDPLTVFKSNKVFIGKRNHQTEKPQDILEFFLKYWTDEGDVVLDPTMGSGSTGVACKKLGREFIGIELDEKYFNVAVDRINVQH